VNASSVQAPGTFDSVGQKIRRRTTADVNEQLVRGLQMFAVWNNSVIYSATDSGTVSARPRDLMANVYGSTVRVDGRQNVYNLYSVVATQS
jgi:hypothetical protein